MTVQPSDRVTTSTVTISRHRSARRRYRFDSTASSHVGVVRDHNEDFAFAGHNLVAVADGVGGNVFGEVASEIVIAAIAYLEDRVYPTDPGDEVTEAAHYANERLSRAMQADRALDGMATTLTALRLDGTSLVSVHVGDSRAYALDRSGLRRLTQDDSLVQELVDAGAITEAQARRHPARSVVLQALDGGPFTPHVATEPVRPGDRFLVCSDGLSDYVDAATIENILRTHTDRERCCAALTEAALEVGAPDNVTCVVADVRELDPAP